MNLIIDQGNTATKLALFEGDKRLITKQTFLKSEVQKVEQWILTKAPSVDAILVSSVTNDRINLPNKKTIFLNENTELPIQIGYKTPHTLGKDRMANAVGVWTKNPNKNSLCIDLGTCIKYDIVNDKGVYLGGNIGPGLKMRYQSLADYTDQLPLLAPSEFEFGYGTNTEMSIKNGVQQAIFHEINGFIDRYIEQFGQLTIFMTDGDIKYFDKGYKKAIFADSDLTVYGLNEILRYNAET